MKSIAKIFSGILVVVLLGAFLVVAVIRNIVFADDSVESNAIAQTVVDTVSDGLSDSIEKNLESTLGVNLDTLAPGLSESVSNTVAENVSKELSGTIAGSYSGMSSAIDLNRLKSSIASDLTVELQNTTLTDVQKNQIVGVLNGVIDRSTANYGSTIDLSEYTTPIQTGYIVGKQVIMILEIVLIVMAVMEVVVAASLGTKVDFSIAFAGALMLIVSIYARGPIRENFKAFAVFSDRLFDTIRTLGFIYIGTAVVWFFCRLITRHFEKKRMVEKLIEDTRVEAGLPKKEK